MMATNIRVLVTGSRNWKNRRVSSMSLGQLEGRNPVVIGADTIADELARAYEFTTEIHRPDFTAYPGHLAPLKRNDAMLDSGIDLCLAFMLGTPEKGGTLYTVNGARARRIPLILYQWPGDPDFKE
jgi:hypothetical protein